MTTILVLNIYLERACKEAVVASFNVSQQEMQEI
jgi:hypothetical protein